MCPAIAAELSAPGRQNRGQRRNRTTSQRRSRGPALSLYFTFQKLLSGLRWRIDLTIDQHPAGISAARTLELPRHIVFLSSQLRPLRSFFWVLLQPEMTFLVSK